MRYSTKINFGERVFEESKHRPGGGGGSFDSVFVFVYNPEQQLGYLAAPALRREGRVSFVVPEWMRGGELQMWGFVQDERGRCSETLYIGHGEAELVRSSESGVMSYAGGTPAVQEGQGAEAPGLDWQTQPSTESTAHYGGRSGAGETPAVQEGQGAEALGLDWQTQPSTESTAHYGGRSGAGGTPAVQEARGIPQ